MNTKRVLELIKAIDDFNEFSELDELYPQLESELGITCFNEDNFNISTDEVLAWVAKYCQENTIYKHGTPFSIGYEVFYRKTGYDVCVVTEWHHDYERRYYRHESLGFAIIGAVALYEQSRES